MHHQKLTPFLAFLRLKNCTSTCALFKTALYRLLKMTKDWDAVQAEIKELSGVQKKRLDEVRKIMETKHGFKAS
jgi:hypothetical protein